MIVASLVEADRLFLIRIFEKETQIGFEKTEFLGSDF